MLIFVRAYLPEIGQVNLNNPNSITEIYNKAINIKVKLSKLGTMLFSLAVSTFIGIFLRGTWLEILIISGFVFPFIILKPMKK
jgi:hypothetical protein